MRRTILITGGASGIGLASARAFYRLGDQVVIADLDASAASAATAVTSLDTAIAALASNRSVIGAAVNRLTYASDNAASMSQNASASRSQIADTDYAAATSELARSQIVQQAGTAMLAQANQQASMVLALLR